MPPHRSRTPACILVVDDEIIARQGLAGMLKARNRKVSLARSGKNALTKVSRAKSDIDVILMDIKMPGEFDGIEAAHRIQQHYGAVPIIFLTAFADDCEYRRRVKEAGLRIADWVDKPIIASNRKKLQKVVDRELEKKEIRVQIEKALRENAPPVELQTLLKELVSLHGVDLIAEIIQDLEWINSINGLNTDDLFPYLNFIVYENLKAKLEKEYLGQYVAFLDGKFVGNHHDRDELIKIIYQKYERTDIFIEEIPESSSVLKLRRPRKFK